MKGGHTDKIFDLYFIHPSRRREEKGQGFIQRGVGGESVHS